MAYFITNVCLTGTTPTPVPGNRTYRVGLFYSSECPLPVELQSFSVE